MLGLILALVLSTDAANGSKIEIVGVMRSGWVDAPIIVRDDKTKFGFELDVDELTYKRCLELANKKVRVSGILTIVKDSIYIGSKKIDRTQRTIKVQKLEKVCD